MSVTVTLYSFSKRENSTKQPTGGGTDYSCVMLDDTSLMNPVFKLEIAANPIDKNYAYVADFNRYYFINDISTYQGFWYISCTCDVLASFKTAIGSGSHYVLRAASDFDGTIIDSIYTTKAIETAVKTAGSNPFSWSLGHSYVIGIIGYAPSASKQVGSVTYYHMNDAALQGFITYLMQDVGDWSDITTSEYDQGVQEALLNPINYIVSCIALPIAPPATLSVNTVYFGYYFADLTNTSGATMAVLEPGDTITETFNISSVPVHPQAATRGKYLNAAPYMSRTLHFGPFGDIEINPSSLIDATGVTASMLIDKMSGNARCLVYPTNNPSNVLFTGTTQVGVEINLSQVLKNPLDRSTAVNTGLLNTAQGFVSLNPFTTLNAWYQTFDNAARTKVPNVSAGGTNGSFLTFFDSEIFYLLSKYYEITDENLTELGRPCCKLKTINTLSGFVVCSDADVEISGTQDEAQKINGYMNNGFFYE